MKLKTTIPLDSACLVLMIAHCVMYAFENCACEIETRHVIIITFSNADSIFVNVCKFLQYPVYILSLSYLKVVLP